MLLVHLTVAHSGEASTSPPRYNYLVQLHDNCHILGMGFKPFPVRPKLRVQRCLGFLNGITTRASLAISLAETSWTGLAAHLLGQSPDENACNRGRVVAHTKFTS